MKRLVLSDGSTATVDDRFYDALVAMASWNPHNKKVGTGYVAGYRRGSGRGRRKMVFLHRAVMELDGVDVQGKKVDHKNNNRRDNRRSNLRVCQNNRQNSTNTSRRSDNTTGFKGVSFHKKRQLFRATIHIKGKHHELGYFDTAQEAARAYDKAAIKHFGEFAKTNKQLKAQAA